MAMAPAEIASKSVSTTAAGEEKAMRLTPEGEEETEVADAGALGVRDDAHAGEAHHGLEADEDGTDLVLVRDGGADEGKDGSNDVRRRRLSERIVRGS